MEFVKLIRSKINMGFGGGPTSNKIFFEIRMNLNEISCMQNWCFFIRFGDMNDILYVHYYALIPFCDSALPFADQVRIHFHFGYPLLHILILICA